MYEPQSMVYLMACSIEQDQQNQIMFANETERQSYFLTLANTQGMTIDNCRYVVNTDGIAVLNVKKKLDEVQNMNYCCYLNTNFNAKMIYCFVTGKKMLAEDTTQLTLKVDVFQTWFSSVSFNKSFVVREHWLQNGDYYNTLSDEIPTGNLIVTDHATYDYAGAYFIFCNSDVTTDDTASSASSGFTVGNYHLPCYTMYFPMADSDAVKDIILAIGNKGRGDRVLACVYVPYCPASVGIVSTTVTSDIGTFQHATSATGTTELLNNLVLTESHCKKCYTFPYSKIEVEDAGTGQTVELQPEKFSNPLQPTFVLESTIDTTPTLRIIPQNYKGKSNAFTDMLCVTSDTSLPTYNNLYASYMMMNKQSNQIQMLGAVVGGVSSVATMNPMAMAGGVASSALSVASIVAQENKAGKQGNQVSSFKDSAMLRVLYENGVNLNRYMMDSNHLQMAESYWKRYGYPMRIIKVPNLTSSDFNYNYVQLIDPQIAGNIPQQDMDELKQIFVRGITLFHNSTVFLQF